MNDYRAMLLHLYHDNWKDIYNAVFMPCVQKLQDLCMFNEMFR